MKLIGDLKKQVDNAKDISEKRSIIEKAGMKLSDEELDMVAGGTGCEFQVNSDDINPWLIDEAGLRCPKCGQPYKGTSCGACGAQGLEQSPIETHELDPNIEKRIL